MPIRESPDSVPGRGMEKINAPRGEDDVDCGKTVDGGRVVDRATAIIGISPASTSALSDSWAISTTEGIEFDIGTVKISIESNDEDAVIIGSDGRMICPSAACGGTESDRLGSTS